MMMKIQKVPEGMKKCMRCSGRKKLYKTCGGWSYTDSGGKLEDCPMCRGGGLVKTLDQIEKDFKDDKKKRPGGLQKKREAVDVHG